MAEVVVIIAVQLYEVVARYVFNAPTLWGSDIAYMTNGTLFLLGAAYTLAWAHTSASILSRPACRCAAARDQPRLLPRLFLPMLWYVGSASANRLARLLKGELERMSAWEPLVWPFYTGMTIGCSGSSCRSCRRPCATPSASPIPRAVPPPGTTIPRPRHRLRPMPDCCRS